MLKTKFLLLACLLLVHCQGHSHSHDSDDHHGHSHGEAPSFKYSQAANEQHSRQEKMKPVKKAVADTFELWLHAMGSTLLISAAPFFLLFLIPLDSTDKEQRLLKILLAFAAGGLLGDAFLHLIPHALLAAGPGGHTHSHSHDAEEGGHAPHDTSVGLWVLIGIITFLVVEKGVRIIKGSSHAHSHSKPAANDKKNNGTGDKDNKSKKEKKETGDKDNKSQKNEEHEGKKEIKVAGYLNLAADFCHNFTDGLAIGASYLAGNTIGILTTFAILVHEVPHEIGDFAILIQSGVSRKNAILLQLTTAVGAIAGTAISLLAQNTIGDMATQRVLSFTAGGFIYIALASVIPELLDEDKPTMPHTIFQMLAMLSGICLMLLIAAYE